MAAFPWKLNATFLRSEEPKCSGMDRHTREQKLWEECITWSTPVCKLIQARIVNIFAKYSMEILSPRNFFSLTRAKIFWGWRRFSFCVIKEPCYCTLYLYLLSCNETSINHNIMRMDWEVIHLKEDNMQSHYMSLSHSGNHLVHILTMSYITKRNLHSLLWYLPYAINLHSNNLTLSL